MKHNPENQISAERQRFEEAALGVLFFFGRGRVPALAFSLASHARSWCVSVWRCLLFGILSPPPEVQPCQYPSCVFPSPLACHSPPPSLLVIVLSLVYSLTLAFSHVLSHRLARFSSPVSPRPSLALSSLPIYSPALCSCSLREMEVCKLFPLDGCLACYLPILMNSFPPFFPPKSSGLRH